MFCTPVKTAWSRNFKNSWHIITFQLKTLQRERDKDKISLSKFRDELQTLEVKPQIWNVQFFFLCSVFPSAILSRHTAADFVLIFHQRGIEEAQFRLQRRDDVIDQVGTELAWLSSESLCRNPEKFVLPHKYLDRLCPLLFELIFTCVWDRKTCSWSTQRKRSRSIPAS